MKDALTYASSALAFLSAALWFWACFVSTPYAPKPAADGWTALAITDDGKDVLRTAKRQTKWNAWAAAVAGLAAPTPGRPKWKSYRAWR
jgi:hypothetical protein